jgi:transcriptional regulator NrdR family protein
MNKAKDKKILKEYLGAIVVSISGIFENETSIKMMQDSKSVPEFFNQIVLELKDKEKNGWDGSDLGEDQLNALTIISEVYAKRNKSKYKNIEKPSEIISWFSTWVQSVFSKSELKWSNFI